MDKCVEELHTYTNKQMNTARKRLFVTTLSHNSLLSSLSDRRFLVWNHFNIGLNSTDRQSIHIRKLAFIFLDHSVVHLLCVDTSLLPLSWIALLLRSTLVDRSTFLQPSIWTQTENDACETPKNSTKQWICTQNSEAMKSTGSYCTHNPQILHQREADLFCSRWRTCFSIQCIKITALGKDCPSNAMELYGS